MWFMLAVIIRLSVSVTTNMTGEPTWQRSYKQRWTAIIVLEGTGRLTTCLDVFVLASLSFRR